MKRPVDQRVERLASALGIFASIWFAFTAWWGEGQIPAGGHIGGGAAATTMLAEASIRWRTIYPLFDWYASKNPYPGAAYCHHPFGQYWASSIALLLFGHRDFVVELPAAVMSTLTVPLLYKIGKRAWGPLAGAAAAMGFAFLPITAGFSQFHNLEVMVIFGVVVFFHGHLAYQETGRARDLLVSLAGACVACSGDWVGYLIMAPLLAWSFFRACVLPKWATPYFNAARQARWWAWSVCIAVGTLALWVALFKHVDKLDDWLNSADSRSGADDKLAKVLEARKTWIEFSFTPLAISIGKLAAWVGLARLVWRRCDEEILSLATLFGAVVQYVVFKRAADVHIFWPHYFGLYYGLALAQLVASAEDIARFVTRLSAPMKARIAGSIAAAVVLVVPTVLIAPDAVRGLVIWRETGGKYNDNGAILRSHVDLLFVLEKLIRPHVREGVVIGYHGGANWGWEPPWAIRGLSQQSENPSDAYPFWIARASGLGADHLRELSRKYHLRIYGDVIVITRGEPAAPLDAFSLNEHEPNPIQWMFVNNVEPVRRIDDAPDPFLTWEWRTHLDQPAPMPTAAPRTLDEIRIAHNAGVARGDDAEAARLLDQIRKALVRDPESHYDGEHELMGVRLTHGVQPKIETWFQAGGPTAAESLFSVRSQIVRKNPLSLMPIDPVEREMAHAPALSTKLWKRGFVYTFEAVLLHRIGLERYYGQWRGGPPIKRGGGANVDLAFVP